MKTSANYLYWKALVNVLIRTALRRGEMVGLQWGDIDKKKLVIHVRRNVTIDASNKDNPNPEKKIKTISYTPADDDFSKLVIESINIVE